MIDRFTLNRFLPIPISTDFENFNITDIENEQYTDIDTNILVQMKLHIDIDTITDFVYLTD